MSLPMRQDLFCLDSGCVCDLFTTELTYKCLEMFETSAIFVLNLAAQKITFEFLKRHMSFC